MASLDWHQTRRDGVTLVELVVGAEAAEWVRVESRLQPVWPPRRQGVPVAGWDGASFEGRIEPDAPLVLGYASPAAPLDPPAQLTTVDDSEESPDGTAVSPRAIVRTLGESAPPRDVVPAGTGSEQTESGDSAAGTPATAGRPPPAGSTTSTATAAVSDPEAAIEPWFDAVGERLGEAERLADVTGVEEAHGAVEAVGGIDAARDLRKQLEADRQQLRRLRERQQRLAERLAAVEIPLSTLERVT
ncbi:hypothetical protein BRD19_02945 [Halobacteriales archaeon SW_7_65_23]|nr:MAG: hypothetical protein BRD19_02945 [Halobacteriales archaeon SW_7_65_23]